MAEEKLSFQTEVSRLLRIVANSLYSEKRIFLRELISNASDACDRLRYEAITEPGLTEDDPEFRVRIELDPEARTISVADNGIGMNRDGLIADLGTIARSGTTAYLEQMSDDAAEHMALIGQFGVGFYSAFMVADRVEVTSRRAGEDGAWRWASEGLGEFTVGEAERAGRGTTVTLHIRDGEDAFLEPATLRGIVKTYSDHIALPIVLAEDGSEETVNEASAALGPPAGRHHRRPVRGILPPCRPCLRRAVDDDSLAGRGGARIHHAGLRPLAAALRPVQPGAQACGEALREARVRHRRLRRAGAAMAALPPRSGRQRGSAAQHQPRDAAEQPAARPHADGDRPARPRRARQEGRGGAGELRRVLGEFRPGPQGGPLRGCRQPRRDPQARPVSTRPEARVRSGSTAMWSG